MWTIQFLLYLCKLLSGGFSQPFLQTARECNVFRSICQPFCPQEGLASRVCLLDGGRLPPGGSAYRGSVYWGVCIQEGLRRPLGYTLAEVCIRGRSAQPAAPIVVTFSSGHCSGQYTCTSYWNAFLFYISHYRLTLYFVKYP